MDTCLGRTRCYWALLSADLQFIYLDPVLASHLDSQADLLLGKNLLSFVHPEEQVRAKSDLAGVLDSRALHGSVTRVRFSRLSRIRRQLGHTGPPSPWPYSERISVDTNYMTADIVINWAAEGLVLCFIHATTDIDPSDDNDEYNKSSWSNWCGTTLMHPEQVQVLFSRLLHYVPHYQPYSPSFVGTSGYDNSRVFQILANQPGRPLLLSWPPDQGNGPTGRDFARLVENAALDTGPQKSNDAKTSCTRRYRATQLMSPALGEVESVFIPHGSVIFACHKVESAIRSTSGAVPMSFSASTSTFASGPPASAGGTGFNNMQHQHHPAYTYGSINPGSGYPPSAPSYYDPHASYALPPVYQPAYGHTYPSLTQPQTLHAQNNSNTAQTQQLSPYTTTPSPRWPQQQQQQPQSPVYPATTQGQSQHWSVSGPSSSPTVSLPHPQTYPHPSSYSSPLSPLTPQHPPSISIPPSASSSSSASVGISPQGHMRSESGNHAGAGAGSVSATTTPVSPRGQVWHTPPAPSGNDLGNGNGDGSANVYRPVATSTRTSAYTTASSGAGTYQPQRTDSGTPQAGAGGETRGELNMNIPGMNMGASPTMSMSLGHPLLPGASSLLSAAAVLGSGSAHNGLGSSGGLGSTGSGMSLNTGMSVGDRTFVQTIIPPVKRKISLSAGDQIWRRTSSHAGAGVMGPGAAGKGGAGVKPEGGRNVASRPVGVMQCSSCGATTSPEWRKGPSGKKELCNACGLRYARSRAKREGTATGTRKKKTDKLQLQMQIQPQQLQRKNDERNKTEHVSSPFVSSDVLTMKKPRLSEESDNRNQRTSSASPLRRPFEQYSPGQGHSQVQSIGYEKRHTPLATVSTTSDSPEYARAMLRRSFESGQRSEYGTTENGQTQGHSHYASLATDGPPGTCSSAEGSGTGSRSVLTPTPTPSPPASASVASPGSGGGSGNPGIAMPLGLGAGDSLALPLPIQRRGDIGHFPGQGQRQEYGFVHYNPAQHQRREESQSHSTSVLGHLVYPEDPSPREYSRDRESSNDRDRSQTQLPPLAYMDRNLSSMHGVGEIKSEERGLNSQANAREPLTPLSAESPSSTGPGSSKGGNGRNGNGVVIGTGGRA